MPQGVTAYATLPSMALITGRNDHIWNMEQTHMTQRNNSPARRLAARTALAACVASVGIALLAGSNSAAVPSAGPAEAATQVSWFSLRQFGFDQRVVRGWMGVRIQPITGDITDSLGLKKADGILVDEPQSGSPAAKAGVLAGDIITAVDGKEVKDVRDLARKIGAIAPGTVVNLSVLRKGVEKTLSLKLGQQPRTV
jgi:S1-C subfamily serine protease